MIGESRGQVRVHFTWLSSSALVVAFRFTHQMENAEFCGICIVVVETYEPSRGRLYFRYH